MKNAKMLIEGLQEAVSFSLFFIERWIFSVFILLLCEIDRKFALEFMNQAISEGYNIIIEGCDIISIEAVPKILFRYCNINTISIDCYGCSPYDMIDVFFFLHNIQSRVS